MRVPAVEALVKRFRFRNGSFRLELERPLDLEKFARGIQDVTYVSSMLVGTSFAPGTATFFWRNGYVKVEFYNDRIPQRMKRKALEATCRRIVEFHNNH